MILVDLLGATDQELMHLAARIQQEQHRRALVPERVAQGVMSNRGRDLAVEGQVLSRRVARQKD